MTPARVAKFILSAIVLPIVVGVVALFVITNTSWGNERARQLIVSQANKRIAGELSIGSLHGALLTHAELGDVRLLDSARKPLFDARRVSVHYGLLAALQGHVVIHSLVLDTANVLLDKQPGARWNFQSLTRSRATGDSTRKSTPPELRDITIHHGRFLYRRPWTPDSSLTGIKRDSAITHALSSTNRRRIESVPGGFQRVLDYHDIDTRIPAVRIASGTPTIVEIASLAMVGEPYRPPAIDVRSLTGTLYASKDSIWWRGARMKLPASDVSGDGTIGFHRAGFRLDLTGNPITVADLAWLAPSIKASAGGKVHYVMDARGDSITYAVNDIDVHYDSATVRGLASLTVVSPKNSAKQYHTRGVDLDVAHLSTATLVSLVPSLELNRTGSLDGHISAKGATELLGVNADVTFNDVAAGRSRITARGDVSLAGGGRAHDLALQFLPLQVGTIAPRMAIHGVMTGSATVSGGLRDGLTGRADVVHVDGNDRSHIAGTGRYAPKGKLLSADVRLLPVSMVTLGKLAPKAELRGDMRGELHVDGTMKNLKVRGRLEPVGGGSVNANAQLAFAHGALGSYSIVAVADALDASVVSKRSKPTSVTGRIEARGAGTKPATAVMSFAGDLRDLKYDTLHVSELAFHGRLDKGLLHLDSLNARERGINVASSGTLGIVDTRRGVLNVSATIDSAGSLRSWIGASDSALVEVASGRQGARMTAARADSVRRAELLHIEQLALGLPPGVPLIVDTIRGIRRDSLAGTLDARATLSGNIKELGVDATVRGAGLVIRGMSADRILATIKSNDALHRSVPLSFQLDANGIQARGLAFDSVATVGTWKDKRIDASLRVAQDALVRYAASGSYDQPDSTMRLVALEAFTARTDSISWKLTHRATARFGSDRIGIDSLELRSSSGARLFAYGAATTAEAPMHFEVAAARIPVANILRALQQKEVADGLVSASFAAAGTRSDPRINGVLTIDSAHYADVRIPLANATMRYAKSRLAVDATAHDSSGRRILALVGAAPLNLAFVTTDSSRKLAGALAADVTLDSLPLTAIPFRSHDIDEFHGTVSGGAHVRGDWKEPLYSGQLALRDAGLTLPPATTGTRIEHAVADVRLAGDSIVLDSLVAQAKGTLRASGSVDIADRAHPFVRVSMQGQNVRVFDSPRGLVDADARISAIGPLDSIRVTGQGEMLGGFLALKQFRKDLLRVKAPGSLSFFTAFDTVTPPGNLARAAAERAKKRRFAVIADLDLVVDPGNYYRNHPDASTGFHTGEGEVVRAHIDQRSGDEWEIGFVRVAGGVAIFRTRAFIPARGALTFGTYTGAPGIVQQVGERTIWEYGRGYMPVQLLTGGTSTAPSVGIESGALFPMRGRELNGYLTLGRLPLSLIQQSGSSLSGSEAWSGQLTGEVGALARRQQAATALGVVLHDIGTGATKEFGLDVFSVSPGDLPNELVLGKTGGVRGAVIEGGRYITPDFYVAGQLHFTSGFPGLRLEKQFGTSYRLDLGFEPRFLFEAPEDLGITHPTSRTGAFGAFLTRLWGY